MFKMHGHMTLLFEGSFKYFAILQGICRVFQVFLQGLKGFCMVILNLAKKDKRMVYAWFGRVYCRDIAGYLKGFNFGVGCHHGSQGILMHVST